MENKETAKTNEEKAILIKNLIKNLRKILKFIDDRIWSSKHNAIIDRLNEMEKHIDDCANDIADNINEEQTKKIETFNSTLENIIVNSKTSDELIKNLVFHRNDIVNATKILENVTVGENTLIENIFDFFNQQRLNNVTPEMQKKLLEKFNDDFTHNALVFYDKNKLLSDNNKLYIKYKNKIFKINYKFVQQDGENSLHYNSVPCNEEEIKNLGIYDENGEFKINDKFETMKGKQDLEKELHKKICKSFGFDFLTTKEYEQYKNEKIKDIKDIDNKLNFFSKYANKEGENGKFKFYLDTKKDQFRILDKLGNRLTIDCSDKNAITIFYDKEKKNNINRDLFKPKTVATIKNNENGNITATYKNIDDANINALLETEEFKCYLEFKGINIENQKKLVLFKKLDTKCNQINPDYMYKLDDLKEFVIENNSEYDISINSRGNNGFTNITLSDNNGNKGVLNFTEKGDILSFDYIKNNKLYEIKNYQNSNIIENSELYFQDYKDMKQMLKFVDLCYNNQMEQNSKEENKDNQNEDKQAENNQNENKQAENNQTENEYEAYTR